MKKFLVFSAHLHFIMAGGRKVAGVIPCLEDGKMLLVSNDKGHYIFPKGGVKTGESLKAAAAREALEEAGIEGIVESKVFNAKDDLSYFVMRIAKVNKAFEEDDVRKRIILTPDEVLGREDVPEYIKVLVKASMKDAQH